jgi:hypothetical protein
VVSELELAGVEFHHCYVGEARGVVGVRLDLPGDSSAPTDLDPGPIEQQPPAEAEHTTAREPPRIITALLIAREAALVWIVNAARRARRAMRGGIGALPAVSPSVAGGLNGRGAAEHSKSRLSDRLKIPPLPHRLTVRPLIERLKVRPLTDRLKLGPLPDRLHGRSRGLVGLGAIVVAMAIFAAVGLTAGGGRPHRAAAHHRHARVLSVAGAGRRPHVAHHPRPSQATGTTETTSTCSACQVVPTTRSTERPLRRARPFRAPSHHAPPAPRVRAPAPPPKPRTPAHRTPTGGHHTSTSTTPTTPSDQQTKTTGGTAPSQP